MVKKDSDHRKKIMKDIILQLHKGLSIEDAKRRFEKEIGNIGSTEIFEIEQDLIKEGLSPDEIKKFCNVHVLLFESALKKPVTGDLPPMHPITHFKSENRAIEKITGKLEKLSGSTGKVDLKKFKKECLDILRTLKKIDTHYMRKEQVLFPYLEKAGFHGPSQVMWGKHNDIRQLLNKSMEILPSIEQEGQLNGYIKEYLKPLVEEVNGMIFKEENILFPSALEKLKISDWVEILKQSDEVGYIFIERPAETKALIDEMHAAVVEQPAFSNGTVSLPTGTLNIEELMGILNNLPVDISFVDNKDELKYFSDNRDRIFVRTRSSIGRHVTKCHPPQSVHKVLEIIESFREGKRNSVAFWIPLRGKFIYIRYFAVRSTAGEYLGTLEVTQDISDIQKIKGEKKLLDERD